MEDRLTRGFIAGVISGIVTNAFNILLGASGLSELRFLDWTGIVMYDHIPPFTLGEMIFALVGQLIFTGGLGVLFIYLIPLITSKNLLFKSWLWGASIWFVIDGLTTLYKMEGISPTSLGTSVGNYLSASLYGLVLAPLLARLAPMGEAGFSLMPAPAAAKRLAENDNPPAEENSRQEK